MTTYGYARVSTDGQTFSSVAERMKTLGPCDV
jgi:DNA invertase Pin-like site-specific DNA recombinase